MITCTPSFSPTASEPLLHGVEAARLGRERHQHGHRENGTLAENGLADVVDVSLAFGERRHNRRDDAAAILAQNGDDALHGCSLSRGGFCL